QKLIAVYLLLSLEDWLPGDEDIHSTSSIKTYSESPMGIIPPLPVSLMRLTQLIICYTTTDLLRPAPFASYIALSTRLKIISAFWSEDVTVVPPILTVSGISSSW